MSNQPEGLSAEDLAAESATALPDKEVVSILDLNADLDIAIDGTLVCGCGQATGKEAAFEGDEVEIEIGLPGEGAETEVFFSDLGHEYIHINADYTT